MTVWPVEMMWWGRPTMVKWRPVVMWRPVVVVVVWRSTVMWRMMWRWPEVIHKWRTRRSMAMWRTMVMWATGLSVMMGWVWPVLMVPVVASIVMLWVSMIEARRLTTF